MVNLHTGERLDEVYWADGLYQSEACAAFNRLLRDHRTGEVAVIDPAALDLAHALAQAAGALDGFEIISGYRSPATNQALRAASSGVARGSLHMQGKALDVRAPGVDLTRLHRTALGLGRGGVGFYAASNFIHIDVGRVRSW